MQKSVFIKFEGCSYASKPSVPFFYFSYTCVQVGGKNSKQMYEN